MYVCICHAVTEKDIQKATSDGVCSIAQLSELTMLGTHCGCCTQHAAEILHQCANKPA